MQALRQGGTIGGPGGVGEDDDHAPGAACVEVCQARGQQKPHTRVSNPMTEHWPFQDPQSLATISLKRIVQEGVPILHVSHDADGDWQFLDGSDDLRTEDACVVGLADVVKLDETVCELVDLLPGWVAWRETASSPWRRARMRRRI